MIFLLGHRYPCHGSTLHRPGLCTLPVKRRRQRKRRSSTTRTGRHCPVAGSWALVLPHGIFGILWDTEYLRYGIGRDHSEWLGAATFDFSTERRFGNGTMHILTTYAPVLFFGRGKQVYGTGSEQHRNQMSNITVQETLGGTRQADQDRKNRARLARPRRTGFWMERALSRPWNW